MTDVGFLSVAGAVVGQTFHFSWANATSAATLGQMYEDKSDIVIINNLSACTFRATLDASGRSFTLPAGVPTEPIPVSFRGTSDQSITLFVDSVSASATPNQVHFDWFGVGQPFLYVSAASGGVLGVPDRILDPTDNIGVLVTDNAPLNFVQLTPTHLNRGIILQGIDALGAVYNMFAIESVGTKVDIFPAAASPSNNFMYVQANAQFSAHLIAVGTTPTLGSLQTGISTQALLANSTDIAGAIQLVTTGSPPGGGSTIVHVNFGVAYGGAPAVFLSGVFQNVFAVTNVTTSGFDVVTLSALAGSTTFFMYYLAIQY